MVTSNKSTTMVLAIVCVVLLLAVGYLYYANYMNLAPNHPNSPYASLFPGMNFNSAKGPDMGQMMSMSMVFVVKNTNNQFGNNSPYGLGMVSRMGCTSYAGYSLSASQGMDLAPYVGKAVLVRKYTTTGENSSEIVLQQMDMDQYVNDHMTEYRAACSVPFASFGL